MNKKTSIKAISFLMAAGSAMAQNNEPLPLHEVQFNFKPNVLWLSCEDISHHYLPMYGDSTIETPFLSRLAKEGIVFTHVHATAGVCAPSRCSIITGMYPTSIGGHNMRTVGEMPLPDDFQFLPEYFKDAGYYCTNNVKTDYNISWDASIWDENGYTAHWKHREPGQPFFAVFNGTLSHESRIFYMMWDNCFMPDTAGMKIPPYFPQNDPVIKQDVARNYSNIIMADKQAEHFYRELENSGLLDSTIIVFWSDHGGPLPRGKREIYNSGTQVPMIIRFPEKLFAGQRCDQLVSLMDLGPAMLSLCGIKPSEHFEGRAFAGKNAEAEPEFILATRDRLGANPDTRRAVISKDYLYIRNYHPEMPMHHREIYRNQI
ncbi:MAG: sulfatase, partial [Tangfeifania sp.]